MREPIMGATGKMWPMRLPPESQRPTPDQAATLAAWMLKIPGWNPAWDMYCLSVVHLRDIPGASKPPFLKFPEATHEILLVALDPQHAPDPEQPFHLKILTPVNVTEQFTVSTDLQAVQLCEKVAYACLEGKLPIECQGILGAKELWHSVIHTTSEHIRTGKHSEENEKVGKLVDLLLARNPVENN